MKKLQEITNFFLNYHPFFSVANETPLLQLRSDLLSLLEWNFQTFCDIDIIQGVKRSFLFSVEKKGKTFETLEMLIGGRCRSGPTFQKSDNRNLIFNL